MGESIILTTLHVSSPQVNLIKKSENTRKHQKDKNILQDIGFQLVYIKYFCLLTQTYKQVYLHVHVHVL